MDGDGSMWTNSSYLHIGRLGGNGILNITAGGDVSNTNATIGIYSGATGVVTVNGPGSTWTNSGFLHVGRYESSGTLNITNGGVVNVQDVTFASCDSGSGTINFDNGTLATGSLICATNDLTGTGTINTHGLVSDVDLVFDATHGLNKILNINDNPEQNITINLNVDGSGSLGAGFSDVGTMRISDGKIIESISGYVGYNPGSTGIVTVNGAGTTWINSRGIYIGFFGNGELNITGGGVVSNSSLDTYYNYIGHETGATGVVKVDGTDSMWTNNGNLYIGRYEASGILNITDGGLVSIGRTLSIDYNEDGSGFINMATGGMLALKGDADASGSLLDFLDLIDGTDAIRYWDDSILDWADITGATMGEDYWLTYLTEGDLAGYTMLTVGQAILLGDANNDDVVSAGDYACIQANFGNVGIAGMLGDANGDGVVSAGDYACIQANFGNVAGAGVIPEPVTLSLLTLGGLALLRRRN